MTGRIIRFSVLIVFLFQASVSVAQFSVGLSIGGFAIHHGDSKNAEMMLNIARFIIASPKWNNPNIRVLFVNNNNVDVSIIKSKIAKLVEDLRVLVEIKIINNAVEQKPFYDIIEEESKSTNLTLVGIPNYKIEKQAEFVMKTNNLFESIGSTLLVRAANNFNELDLDIIKANEDLEQQEFI